MKKITTILLIALLVGLMSMAPSADFFSGKIFYDIKIEGMESMGQSASAMMAMMPKKAIYYVSDTKMKVETEPKTMMSSTVIMDFDKKIQRVLMDAMGNKIQMKMDEEFAQTFSKSSENTDDIEVKTTDEKKTIAGYECKKVVVKTEESTSVFWVTDKLKANTKGGGMFRGIEGFPLEFSIQQQGIKMQYSATKVEAGKIDAKSFDIPKDYKEMTRDEMMEMFMGR